MTNTDSCKEMFLDGIEEVTLYDANSSSLPIPAHVPQILQMNDCVFPQASLHLSMSGESDIVMESLTAKTTASAYGATGTTYDIEISGTVDVGSQALLAAIKEMRDTTYYIVVRKTDDSMSLFYSLDGTFSISSAVNVQADAESRTLSVTAKAVSDLIPITTK